MASVTDLTTEHAAKLVLPNAPPSERGPVKAWAEPLVLPTYLPAKPDPNPMFLERRVYQGSSGRVYPLPIIDRIDATPMARAWNALHLENEYLRLTVLPELGGRIHVGLDKRTGYDFFYRQNVIKPALVGLAGPWVSGGVEFNWPQHHRPATFMPVVTAIERDPDGAVTVWCSDHDPMLRMKGMHGLCLRPGKAYLEVRVRLYNRTLERQTFLWWANVATHVHEKYQSFFPADVRSVADHAKRAVTEFPLSQGTYYGIDYGQRARNGVPEDERPSHFTPDATAVAANDLGWYANIPVPTSYMAIGSHEDFFGGYDHQRLAGTVAIANHHIAPGKKQWTWGNHEFGYAWDRNLTDGDGPYVELMSGAYTENQPDFSFLAPGETKAFSQFWYPVGDIGVPDHANLEAAVRLERTDAGIGVHLQVTSARPASTMLLLEGGREIARWQGDLTPGRTFHQEFSVGASGESLEFLLRQGTAVLLRYAAAEAPMPETLVAASEPAMPADIASMDELYLTGLHLEQYRHPTRSPEIYWLEAIRRDAGDSRCNHALGRSHLRRGEWTDAERHLRAAIARITARNPNPYDGEPYYTLGLVLRYQRRIEEAYAAFYKSTWNAAWRGPACHRLAEIDCARHQWTAALDHLDQALRADGDNLTARNLKVQVLRKLERQADADALLDTTLALDPLDSYSRYLRSNEAPADGQQQLDLAFDLLRAGLCEEALAVVSTVHTSADNGSATLALYAKANLLHKLGRDAESAVVYTQASAAPTEYVFPSRLEEMLLLEEAISANPSDARARFYLGNFLYDRRRYDEAIALWEGATQLEPALATAWRNLGIAYYNVRNDAARAGAAFTRARALSPQDARILYEQDQLLKRTGAALDVRLSALEAEAPLVEQRDDLSVELATLYNNTGAPQRALTILASRHFQPWEGGEGLVSEQYIRSHVLLAVQALGSGDALRAWQYLEAADKLPPNLSEGRHLLANRSVVHFWMGETRAAQGDNDQATTHWQRAARQRGDFQNMKVQPISEMTFWSAMSLRRLGGEDEAVALFRAILDHASELERQTPTIDYFATSLPTMLLFHEDLQHRQTVAARFLEAQAMLGLGEMDRSLAKLHEVQAMDRSHSGAIDLLRMRGA